MPPVHFRPWLTTFSKRIQMHLLDTSLVFCESLEGSLLTEVHVVNPELLVVSILVLRGSECCPDTVKVKVSRSIWMSLARQAQDTQRWGVEATLIVTCY